jgi:hypothetical protein
MKLKILICSVLATATGALFAMPSFAQNVVPATEAQLQRWIAKDPRLQADPGLMNDPAYLRSHPDFAIWLGKHAAVHQQVREMGAYDRSHQWRDVDWWRHNDPDEMYENHPEWVRNHPEWRNDGDWDDQHHWHDRGWWRDNRRDWVAQHHPEWAEARERHEEKREAKEEKREAHEEKREEKREAKWEKHHDHDGDHDHGHHKDHD